MKEQARTWSIRVLAGLVMTGAAQADEARNNRLPLGEEFPVYDSRVSEPLREPDGDLHLHDALALALLHNPDLAVFSWDLRAAEAAQLQAGAWPNPEVGFEVENFGGGGAFEGGTSAEATLTLSQLVPLGGKRGKRAEVARLSRGLSGWDYEAARIQTYSATVAAFINVLAAQEQLALTDKIVEIARGIQESVSARVEAGGALLLEENRARAATETSLIESELAARRLAVARRELAALWGSDGPQFRRAVGAMEAVAKNVPSLEHLLGRVERNPEVARWTAELELRRAQGRLVGSERMPDLNFDFGIRRHQADDATAFVLGVSAPLPLWDGKREAVREAEYRAEQAGHQRRAAAASIGRDIALAHEGMAGAHQEAVRLRDGVLPEAESAAARSEEAYRAGALQLTDVLDIQRTYFQLRARYVNALARYHRAVAELEGLVGEPVDGVGLDEGNDGTESEQ